MKTLEDIGKMLITHPQHEEGENRLAKCPCGLSHLFRTKPTTEYVDCNCGKRVRLWKESTDKH